MKTPINKYLILLLLPLAGFPLWYFLQYLSHIEYRYGDTEIFVNAVFSYLHESHLYQKPYMVAPMDPSFKFPPIYALPPIPLLVILPITHRQTKYKILFWPLTWLHITRYLLSLVLIVIFFGPWKNLTLPLIAGIAFFAAACAWRIFKSLIIPCYRFILKGHRITDALAPQGLEPYG